MKYLVNYLQFNLDKYGLGKIRTLEDYYNFAGIDIVNKKVYKNFCRENNIATEDDILMSNQINHETNHNKKFIQNKIIPSLQYISILILGLLLLLYVIRNININTTFMQKFFKPY